MLVFTAAVLLGRVVPWVFLRFDISLNFPEGTSSVFKTLTGSDLGCKAFRQSLRELAFSYPKSFPTATKHV